MNRYLIINLLREMKRTWMRFLSILCISMLGVAFFAGIRATSPDMKLTGDLYFDRANLSDITVLCSLGLTDDDLRAIEQIDGVASVVPSLNTDAMLKLDSLDKELNIRLLSMPFAVEEEYPATTNLFPSYQIDPNPKEQLNTPILVKGRMPLDDHEIALDEVLDTPDGPKIGDWITVTTTGGSAQLRIVGFVESPLYISTFERGSSTIGSGESEGFAYVSGDVIASLGQRLPFMAMFVKRYTQLFVQVEGAMELNAFSEEYTALVDTVIERIERYGEQSDGTWYVQDRTMNPGYNDYSQNTDRIAAVGQLFPLIFFIVAALVALTSMTRMVEEQRIQMGTLKALGYSQFAIISEYIIYAALATIVGSVIGCLIGFKLFPTVIGNAYAIMYRLPDFQTPFIPQIAWSAIIVAILCTTSATLFASVSALREVPANLMRPKAPKPGKRVFLERIGFIWKHMNFTSKVTARNLIRYKKRFWMSVIGIAGSSALLVTGFGLKDSIFGIMDRQFEELWKMDVQAYTYDPMTDAQWAELVQVTGADDILKQRMVCNDKILKAGSDERHAEDVHFFVAGDSDTMTQLMVLRRPSGEAISLGDEGVVITEKFASLYGLSAGDTLWMKSGDEIMQAPIQAVAENYVNHYVFCSAKYYQELFDSEILYNGIMATLDDTAQEVKDDLAQRLLGDQRMYTVSFTSGAYESIFDSLNTLNYVVLVLIVSAAALAFIVMLNLTNINVTERRRELATLQVLGFKDKELYSYVFRENNALSVIGSLLGLVLGIALHQFVIETCEVDIVMFVRDIAPLSFVYSFVMSIGFSLLVNAFMRKKVRSIDMVESLKSAE